MPAWGREIALLAAIHCRHWTGYVFNDYAQVLGAIRWLAERIEGRRVLAYLSGWEGRYYWQYGIYRPEPRMGGEEGFARLVDGARELGVQIMAMFGANYANKGLPNYEQWGAPAEVLSAGGNRRGGSVDWDGSRHFDHGSGALLNPGAPTWQNHLVSQVHNLVDRYGFNGVYLDISAMWLNDPRYDVHRGTVELIRRIREGHPEILIGGEGWYDAIGRRRRWSCPGTRTTRCTGTINRIRGCSTRTTAALPTSSSAIRAAAVQARTSSARAAPGVSHFAGAFCRRWRLLTGHWSERPTGLPQSSRMRKSTWSSFSGYSSGSRPRWPFLAATRTAGPQA